MTWAAKKVVARLLKIPCGLIKRHQAFYKYMIFEHLEHPIMYVTTYHMILIKQFGSSNSLIVHDYRLGHVVSALLLLPTPGRLLLLSSGLGPIGCRASGSSGSRLRLRLDLVLVFGRIVLATPLVTLLLAPASLVARTKHVH